eukprot:GHVR01082219.1.p1 GENE.GHVR01082219.1~~GHVR01082219.1.p1  ORF type:complete len:106 (-),score=0.93 GHVR01082219.1:477-794(-)
MWPNQGQGFNQGQQGQGFNQGNQGQGFNQGWGNQNQGNQGFIQGQGQQQGLNFLIKVKDGEINRTKDGIIIKNIMKRNINITTNSTTIMSISINLSKQIPTKIMK